MFRNAIQKLRVGRRCKVTASDLRAGNVIEYNGRVVSVVRACPTRNGRGASRMDTELKDMAMGTKISERFALSETFEEVVVSSRRMEYLYHTDTQCVFIDDANNEVYMATVDIPNFGSIAPILQFYRPVQMTFFNDKPALINSVRGTYEFEIEEQVGGLTGYQHSAVYRAAICGGGVTVDVPHHCAVKTRAVFNMDCDFNLAFKVKLDGERSL